MIPGPAIEYLLTLRRPGGGTLVALDATQILVPAFPPATTLSFSAGPIGDDFGQIVYGARPGPDMVPNAFTGYVQVWGSRLITGTFTLAVLITEMQSFLWVTQAEPALIYLTNVSGLNQVLELDYVSLRIASEEDFNMVLEALARLGTSARLEQLGREATELLRILTGGPPAPRPPIGGA